MDLFFSFLLSPFIVLIWIFFDAMRHKEKMACNALCFPWHLVLNYIPLARILWVYTDVTEI